MVSKKKPSKKVSAKKAATKKASTKKQFSKKKERLVEMSDPFQNKHSDPSNSGSTTLSVNGLSCTFNMPKAVARQKDARGNEVAVGLPPYAPRIGYPVDKFPASPQSWMHGSGKASSYFVPIVPEHGMWLDFNGNSNHTHHVAAVISVQGVNPLTGMKADPIRLEQYKDKCPKHNVDFQQDRFCPSCNFSWHGQNYVSSNSGGPFWIDGFRTEEGVIRQWYFTEEECKGVAAQLIGAERVFAIGIAFYLSKQPKPKPTYRGYYGGAMLCAAGPTSYGAANLGGFESSAKCFSLNSAADEGLECLESVQHFMGEESESAFESTRGDIEAKALKIEIGAGAMITQKIGLDPEKLDFWQDEPAGMLYLNYCDVKTAERILAVGPRQEKKDGFLGGLALKD